MNKNIFKAAMVKQGYTQRRLCAEIPMAESTLIRKLKNDSFTIAEAEKIAKILKTSPGEIFLTSQ